MTSRSAGILSTFAPLLFVVLWSTGFIGSRMGAPYSEPMMFLTLRFGSVLVLLLIISLIQNARWPTPRQGFHAFVSGFLIHGVYLSGVFWAIDDGMPAGLFALMTGLQPVLTAFFAHLILKEQITRNHVIGFLLGLIGISMVLLPRLSGGAFFRYPCGNPRVAHRRNRHLAWYRLPEALCRQSRHANGNHLAILRRRPVLRRPQPAHRNTNHHLEPGFHLCSGLACAGAVHRSHLPIALAHRKGGRLQHGIAVLSGASSYSDDLVFIV